MNKTRWMVGSATCAALVLALAGVNVQAQEPTVLMEAQFGSLSGKVTGPDGKPLGMATVQIAAGGPQSRELPKGELDSQAPGVVTFGRGETIVATAKTDAQGQYVIKQIRVGKYKAVVPATARGLPVRTDVVIEGGKNTVLDLKVEPRK
jgi:hypothetical protein